MSNWLPSLNALRAFDAVARHLSYQKAAEELSVTPAAVKQLVLKLEESLNVQLVKRQGRGLTLTETGLVGIADLSGGFRQLSRAVDAIRQTQERRTLTITSEPSFAIAWLVKRIDGFKQRYPDIDVLIDSSLRVIDLEREPVDIAIRYEVKPRKGMISHNIFKDETLAVCSPSLLAGPPEIKVLEDLEKVPLIHIDISGPDWKRLTDRHLFEWQSWLEAVGANHINPGRGLRFNEYILAIQAAIAGQGVVLGSWPLVRDAIEAGLLVSPFKQRAQAEIGYNLVTSQASIKKPDVAAFVDWMLEEVAK
ncbi:MAG: LysR substrate-binding domain-containing protein [Rhizobiaceae bacterium]